MKRYIVIVALLLTCVAGAVAVGYAATNPWEQPLQDIATSVVGPVALAGFLIAVCFFALMWCFGYAAIGVAVGIVVAGAILGNADTIATWLGVGS